MDNLLFQMTFGYFYNLNTPVIIDQNIINRVAIQTADIMGQKWSCSHTIIFNRIINNIGIKQGIMRAVDAKLNLTEISKLLVNFLLETYPPFYKSGKINVPDLPDFNGDNPSIF